MKRVSALVIVAVLLVITATTAFAIVVNRTPDLTLPHSPELNQASYWGETCTKNDGPFDRDYVILGYPHDLVVIKSAQSNYVWFNTTPGNYGTPDNKDVSHLIYCNEEVYEPCTVTVAGEKEFGEWEALSEPSFGDWVVDGNTRCRTGGQGFAQHWTQNFYDAQNPETVCRVEEGTNYRGQLLRECEEKECEIGMYLLHGYNYPCYLNQNPNHINYDGVLEPDTPWQLPERYDGTVYMQDLCDLKYTCEGWTYDTFEWMETWEFVCDWKPCLDCD